MANLLRIGLVLFVISAAACDRPYRATPEQKRGLEENRLGVEASNRGETDKAIDHFSEAVRLDPRNNYAFRNRGDIWVQKKDYDKAMTDYDEAIRIYPMFKDALCSRGYLWLLKKEVDKAMKDLNDAIQIDPKFAEVYNIRGEVWLAKKEYDKAIADFDECLRLKPDHENAGKNRDFALKAKR